MNIAPKVGPILGQPSTSATSMPVMIMPGAPEHFFNINADMAVAPLARAVAAEAVLFLSDVPALLDGDGVPIEELCKQEC